MSTKRLILLVLAASATAGTWAQVLEPTITGALARSESYLEQNVPHGALDALVLMAPPEGTESEELAAWLKADALFGMGRYRDASDVYAGIAARWPESIACNAALLRMAECRIGFGDYDGAMDVYAGIDPDALDTDGKARTAYGRGICLLNSGRSDRAMSEFEKAARTRGSLRSASNFYLGAIYFGKGDYPAARQYFSGTDASSDPGRHRELYISQMELADGAAERALASARRGLSVTDAGDAERAALERVAGEAQWELGNRDEAVKHLNRHMQLASEPALSACYILGVDAYRDGRSEEAAELLSRASAAPGVLGQSASLALGQALYSLGRKDAAVTAFGRAVEASPSDPEVRRTAFYNYAVAKFAGGNVPFGSVSATFENFLSDYPDGPYSDSVREYLAQGYLADEDYDRALEWLEGISNPAPNVLAAKRHLLYMLGCRELNAGNTEQASAYLDRAAAMQGERALSAEIMLWQGRASAAAGDNAAAARRFSSYLNIPGTPNRAAANYGLGYAMFAQRRYAEADRSFATAAQSGSFRGKELADILNRRADIAYYGSRFDDAAELYGRAFSADRATGDYAAFQQARMYGFRRDYAAELSALDMFRQTFPASALMPDALLEQAAAQVALGRTEDALASYTSVTEHYPLTAQGRRAYIQKAMVLLESGRRDAATDAYKEVIRQYPSSGEATQAANLLRGIMAEQGRGDEYLEFMASVDGAPTVDRTQAATLSYGSAVRALRTGGDSAPMERFLVQYPDAPEAEEAMALLAENDYASDRTPEALARWQALESRASTPAMALRARMGILRAARDLGDNEVAGQAAGRVLESSAATGAAINEATYSRALFLSEDEDKMSEVIELWKSVADDTDDLYGAKSAYAAAEALHASGRIDEALEAVSALVSSHSPHKYWIARAFILRSDILAAQGKTYEAREYLRALLQNYPGSETDIRVMAEQRLSQLSEQ